MSFLQPITHNLPPVIQKPLISLIGQECYTILVWNTDFTSQECLKLALSKSLGLAIVAGGSIVKVPQIIKILRSGSASGLSLSSYVLDTAGLGVTVAYNLRHGFPWSTYGENVFLLVQNVVITFLIITFSHQPNRFLVLGIFALLFALSSYALASPLLPASALQLLAASTIPLSLASKVPQIATNFRNGHTGQLSAFLVFNSLFGCLARVFTTATETKDPVLFWGFLLAAGLNGVIAAQMLAHWNKTDRVTLPVQSEKLKVENGVRNPVVGGVTEQEKVKLSSTSSPQRVGSPVNARKYVRKLD